MFFFNTKNISAVWTWKIHKVSISSIEIYTVFYSVSKIDYVDSFSNAISTKAFRLSIV